MLENEQIGPDEVLSLKDSVEYYLETHQVTSVILRLPEEVEANNFTLFFQDPDFVPDENLYDELPVEKLDSKVGEELSVALSGAYCLKYSIYKKILRLSEDG